MKNTKILVVILSAFLFLLSGCNARMNKGEDLNITNDVEVQIIKMNLRYIKDQNGNCFAVLNNHTDGFRSTFTMASVDCNTLDIN